MLTLYYKPSCPYCQKVLIKAEEMGVQFDLKDIDASKLAESVLIEKGGKRQVPFLVDTETGVSMYESEDIIAYITKNNGASAGIGGLRVHKSAGTSNVCG